MKLIKINVELGGQEFTLKFGLGLISYLCEKENIKFGEFPNDISLNSFWGYKIIFHAIRYYELCAEIESKWSDSKIWDFIDSELKNKEKIDKIMTAFGNSIIA